MAVPCVLFKNKNSKGGGVDAGLMRYFGHPCPLPLGGPNKMGHLRDASVEQIENRLFDKTYLREDGFCG